MADSSPGQVADPAKTSRGRGLDYALRAPPPALAEQEALQILQAPRSPLVQGQSLARETPGAGPARRFSWRQLGEAAQVRLQALRARGLDPSEPLPVVASAEFETLVELFAALLGEHSLLLLHPRWSTSECTAYLGSMKDARLPEGEDCLVIVPTSGSSGAPKGVRLSRRAFLAAVQASGQHLGVLPGDRWLCTLPLAHVGGLSIPLRCAAEGLPLVLMPRLDPQAFAEAFAAALDGPSPVTLCSLVPTQLELLLLLLPGWRPPSTLRAILLGGAATSPSLLARALHAGYPVLPTYGATETCGQLCTVALQSQDPLDAGCGHPLQGMRIEIDPSRQVVATTPALMNGYFPLDPSANPGDHGANAGQATLSPTQAFRCPDLGSLDEAGRLHIEGRADTVINTGGELVQPAAIEAALLGSGLVQACVVLGLADATWGQQVAAAVVLEPASSPSPERLRELRSWAAKALAPAHRPRRYLLIGELPLTPSGKVDRQALIAKLKTVAATSEAGDEDHNPF